MVWRTPNAVSNAINYAMHSSRSHDAVIRVYDAAGTVSTRPISESGKYSAVLLIVEDRLRRGVAQFEVRAVSRILAACSLTVAVGPSISFCRCVREPPRNLCAAAKLNMFGTFIAF
jgi:hypothetical protein